MIRPGGRVAAGIAAGIAAGMVMACSDPARTPPPVPAGAVPAGTAVGDATVAGRVTFHGVPLAPQPIEMASDAACHQSRRGDPHREDLLVGLGGGLRNVFVHVSSGLEGKVFAPPAGAVALDQKGCVYAPHVVGLQVGQPLVLINSDPTLHNVHTASKQNKPFNFGMSVQGQRAERYFHHPEVMIKAKCDVHPWMSSYIGVVAHPFFAVTGEDGAFALRGLAAGTYEVQAWHETLGEQGQAVTLAAGESREVSFAFPK